MRATTLLLLLLVSGCRSAGGPSAGGPSGKAAPRCGGVLPGFDYVAAGMENAFIKAASPQRITFQPGTEVRLGPGKEPRSLTVVARDSNVSIDCACPGGCSASPGCVIVYEPGTPGAGAVCSGDCASESTCCSGCAFWSRW